jgi:hypothetical protein
VVGHGYPTEKLRHDLFALGSREFVQGCDDGFCTATHVMSLPPALLAVKRSPLAARCVGITPG